MIGLCVFTEFLFQECRSKFVQSGFAKAGDIPASLDLIGAGLLDSFDLLNLSIALESRHGVMMDFSVFSEGFDASVTGLHSCLSAFDGAEPAVGDGPVTQVLAELGAAGVNQGDVLLIHSSTLTMGLGSDDCQALYDGLKDLIGPEGTIVAPASNSQAFLDDLFDVQQTPVQADLGQFPEFIRKLPNSVRSSNPFDAVVSVGPTAEEICSGLEITCYGSGSPWRRLLGQDAKLVLLGVDFYVASIVHAAELDAQVPYRSWKEFQGKVVNDVKQSAVTIRLFASALGMKRYYQRIKDLPSLSGDIQQLAIKGGGFVAPLNNVFEACVAALVQDSYKFADAQDAT